MIRLGWVLNWPAWNSAVTDLYFTSSAHLKQTHQEAETVGQMMTNHFSFSSSLHRQRHPSLWEWDRCRGVAADVPRPDHHHNHHPPPKKPRPQLQHCGRPHEHRPWHVPLLWQRSGKMTQRTAQKLKPVRVTTDLRTWKEIFEVFKDVSSFLLSHPHLFIYFCGLLHRLFIPGLTFYLL